MIGRFRQEAQHAAKLRHENIVTLFGCGEHKTLHYLAMEFVEGCNLHQHIVKQGKLDPEQARLLMVQAAKALVCAHEQHIVHRDIKPSNFLLAVIGGRTIVKLTDFGLARTGDDLDGNMTRTGTTVGTVDYISPEQARNSRSADIRSDIYSLGCTLYHMLAGRPPFPGGDLTERLLKHVEAQPPDILQFNPGVSPGLIQILKKMLAKKPEDRYQTPTELLEELANPPKAPAISAREALELLAEASGEKARPSRQSSLQETRRQMIDATAALAAKILPATAEMKLHYRKDKSERRQRPTKGDLAAEEPGSPLVMQGLGPWLVVIGSVTAISLILMAILFKWGGKSGNGPPPVQTAFTEQEKDADKQDIPQQSAKRTRAIDDISAQRRDGAEAGARQADLDASRAAQQLPQIDDRDKRVSDEMRGVFRKIEPPADDAGRDGRAPQARVVQVQRDFGAPGEAHFGSIAAAVAQARAQNLPTVVEIRDNGPFFEPPMEIGGQPVILRGEDGYRPLIALGDLTGRQGSTFLLAVQQGSLALENVDLVLKVPEGQQDVEAGLLRLGQGNLLLEDCTLSLAGRANSGLTAIRLDGAGTGPSISTCTLRRCFFRSADMTAIDIRGPGCSVLAEQCLMVGHEPPLLSFRGQNDVKPTTVRMSHCTLVGGQTLCQFDAMAEREFDSPTQLIFWDCLLARSGQVEGGDLLKLGQNVPLKNVHWRAVNCLYAGWQTLLQYRGGRVAVSDFAGWHSLIHQEGGDKALSLSWPAYLPPELNRVPAALFRTEGTAAAFRDSAGRGAIGCPIRDLPPVRLTWPSYTYDRAATPALDTRAPDKPPEIPALNDGRYHGGRVDVSRIDLGEHLQKLQDAGQLASRVVIHLNGRGTAYVSPFRLKDVHLILYADPAAGSATLTPKAGTTNDALMRIDGGSLELIGVHFSLPVGEKAAEIGSFIQTKNANARLIACRLKGVSAQSSVRTLLTFGGSGDSTPEHSRDCIVADSVMQTSGVDLRLIDNGCRLKIQNSVLVAGEDAIVVEPGTLHGPLSLHCVLDHDTIAGRHAVVRIQDLAGGVIPLDAFPIQSRGCVFVNPFGDLPPKAGLLACEDRALAHGLVSWQPDGNAYDKQLGYALANREGARETVLSNQAAQTIWGPLTDRHSVNFDIATHEFKIEQPAWDRLSLPNSVRAKIKGTPPGADFEQLGIGKR
jgi:hypothetical protein